ncbi:Thermolabile hemolysin [Tolypocladium ophioglossoides CBS 100239]|uniref:Thermolabile hemolysin n=1 Tax=Tolypocladium ophioglossoides (strain CBS 100239) TaxID=1163406 RepID=A0A0L0NGZ3_TOLOC|nr:Thermolabile hemolysin [Tolypocladium ophioglossoides CBS 100239]
MQNLVTFGDSYTDEGRLDYFNSHGKAPPVGSMLPASNMTFSGGYAWGRLVANATGARYYDYAVGGAMCSNDIISRRLDAINGPFPSVLEYEIPTYKEDLSYASLYPDRRADNTVYVLWIGTNDLGIDGFLGDTQGEGKVLTTFVECVWRFFDQIYATGGRRLVLMNELPLQFAPMYATPGVGGNYNDRYLRDPSAYNTTEFRNKMLAYTTSVNTMFDYGAPFYLRVQSRWPGAIFSIFDVHSLVMDVRANPSEYLTAPANITGQYRVCFANCVVSPEPLSSFMWYDELHPSARMEEIIAKNFIDVVNGKSKYGTHYR